LDEITFKRSCIRDEQIQDHQDINKIKLLLQDLAEGRILATPFVLKVGQAVLSGLSAR
jgi:uncharacterized membrane protein